MWTHHVTASQTYDEDENFCHLMTPDGSPTRNVHVYSEDLCVVDPSYHPTWFSSVKLLTLTVLGGDRPQHKRFAKEESSQGEPDSREHRASTSVLLGAASSIAGGAIRKGLSIFPHRRASFNASKKEDAAVEADQNQNQNQDKQASIEGEFPEVNRRHSMW